MKKNFYTFLILICSLAPVYSYSQTPNAGLIGDYSFNGNANDNSSLGNNGVLHGAITLTSGQAGIPNTAYRFAGGTSYIEVPNNSALNVDTAMTIYAVFKAEDYYTAICQGNHLVSRWASTGTNQGLGFGLLFSDQPYDGGNCSNVDTTHDVVYGSTNSNNWQQNLNSAIYIKKNQWYCVAFTHDHHVETMYVNGVVTFSGNVPDEHIGASTSSMRFGADNFGVNSFKGVIDDIKIYNRALSATEISNLCSPCTGAVNFSIQPFGPTTFCAGSNVLLKVNGGIPGTFHWEKNGHPISGATSDTYTANSTGDFTCVSNSACGVFTSNILKLTKLDNDPNSITTLGSTSFCAGDSITLYCNNVTPGYNYKWYRNNISIHAATTIKYIAKNPGTYKVVTTNSANGCARISSNSVNVVVNCRLSAPGNVTEPLEPVKNLTIYPNPNSGSFTVDFVNEDQEDGTAHIEVIDMMGKVVYSGNADFSGGLLNQKIDLQSEFKSGIYLLNVSLNGQLSSAKVLLQ